MASQTINTWCGLVTSRMRRACFIMSASTWSRPAVSMMTTSACCRSASFRLAFATLTGSRPSEKTGTPISRPSVRSCSTAAGRSRSAATNRGRRPLPFSSMASLAQAVVFPEPWTPAIMTTAGRAWASVNGRCSPPRVTVSSSSTTFTICWPGVRLFMTSSDRARSRTRVRRSSATSTETSASSRAVRISPRALSTCFGWSLPRERSFLKTLFRRSVRVSNMNT